MLKVSMSVQLEDSKLRRPVNNVSLRSLQLDQFDEEELKDEVMPLHNFEENSKNQRRRLGDQQGSSNSNSMSMDSMNSSMNDNNDDNNMGMIHEIS